MSATKPCPACGWPILRWHVVCIRCIFRVPASVRRRLDSDEKVVKAAKAAVADGR